MSLEWYNYYMSKQTYYYVVSFIFLLVAAVHLTRIISGWDMVLGGAMIPMWLSWVVVVLLAYLAYRGFSFGRKM